MALVRLLLNVIILLLILVKILKSITLKKHSISLITSSILLALSGEAIAHDSNNIERISVVGREVNLLGQAISASQGYIGQAEISIRPMLRTGEILELVPGMVVSQHSGTGKANQYFLRGFNLDHGSDFSTMIDGMPINNRTHGHGQGYTDLNFIIPEAIAGVSYKKGAYYAQVGDFSGAGSAHMSTLNKVEHGTVSLSLGQDNYQRLVALDSFTTKSGEWFIAVEGNKYDGPWSDIDEDLSKSNLIVKHSQSLGDGQLTMSFMGYDNSWKSADQIPERAVKSGLISELGSIDTTVGGQSSRFSANVQWQNNVWTASAYAISYEMKLWSNFTYFLDDPINGDQFEQVDERMIYGGQVSYQQFGELSGMAMTNLFGVQTRIDDIDEVGLYSSIARARTGVIKADEVSQSSIGVYWENQLALSDDLRTVFGVRYDYFDFDVDSLVDVNKHGVSLAANSGQADDDKISVKASVIYTLNDEWETYASAGQGFHSNDARGTTINVDPLSGEQAKRVDPLVNSFGYEIGLRGFWSERFNTSIALWSLDLDDELLFVGDAGNTESSRESQRKGVEVTGYYRLTPQWALDFEYAYTDSKFSDDAPEGNFIPGALKHVIQAGVNFDGESGWFSTLRMRYFGERPLIEDASVNSDSSLVANFRLGYQSHDWTIKADVLNLFNSDAHDIDYLYESQLKGEASAQEDVHYHVIEPRTVRVSVSYSF